MPNSTCFGYHCDTFWSCFLIPEMHFSLYTCWLVHICVSLLMVLIQSETNQDFILVLQPLELAATLKRGTGQCLASFIIFWISLLQDRELESGSLCPRKRETGQQELYGGLISDFNLEETCQYKNGIENKLHVGALVFKPIIFQTVYVKIKKKKGTSSLHTAPKEVATHSRQLSK